MSLTLNNVSKKNGKQAIFENLTYIFPSHGLIGIYGDSGCGKSTLLDLIAGLKDYEGEISYHNLNLANLSSPEKINFRGQYIGYLTQDNDLFSHDTLLNNLLLPLQISGQKNSTLNLRKIQKLCHDLGLFSKKHESVRYFSGGEIKRAQLAKILVNNPPLILADEPTNGLDFKNSSQVMDFLTSLKKDKLIIVVSHDVALLNAYADILLVLEDGKLIPQSQMTFLEEEKRFFLKKKRKSTGNIPFSFSIKHNYHLIKGQKGRHFAMNFLLMVAFLGFGLATFLKDALSFQISSLITSLIGQSQIIMQSEAVSEDRLIPATSIIARNIYEKYPDLIRYFGSYYTNDLNTFFVEANDLFLNIGDNHIYLPGFDANTLNNYVLLQDVPRLSTHPPLTNEEVILGVPPATLKTLSLAFGINDHELEVNNYLFSHHQMVTLAFKNSHWAYEDEQLFHLKAIFLSPSPLFVHSSPFWNEEIFEVKMRFPLKETTTDPSLPWLLDKIYFLKEKIPFTVIDHLLHDEVFQNIRYEYFFPQGENFKLTPNSTSFGGRIKLYYDRSNSLNILKIEHIKNTFQDLGANLLATKEGYLFHPESFLTGFFHPTFISGSETLLEDLIDYLSFLTHEAQTLTISPPQHIYSGHYLSLGKQSFRLTPYQSFPVLQGFLPNKLQEIVISQTFYQHLFGKNTPLSFPKTLYFTMEKNITFDYEGNKSSDYFLDSLTITGIFSSAENLLFGIPGFEYTYLRDYVGFSAEQLQITKATFIYKGIGKELVKSLKYKYPQFHFEIPESQTKENIQETTAIFQYCLLGLTTISSVNSFILLFILIKLSLQNRKKEITTLFRIGASLKMIDRFNFTYILIVVCLAFLSSIFAFIGLSYLVHRLIGDYLFISLSYTLPYKSLLFMVIFAILMIFFGFYATKRIKVIKKT